MVEIYYQLFIIVKMIINGQNDRSEISAKILKRKKSFYYQNHTKKQLANVHVQGKVFPLNQT